VDGVYARTKTALYRASRTEPSTGVPTFVTQLESADLAAMAIAPDGRVVISAKNQKRYDVVTPQGQASTYLAPADFPLEAGFAGERFVWLSQPFLYIAPGNSVVRIRESGTDRILLDSTTPVGGLVIDGTEAFVMRSTSSGGSILAIDLAKGTQRPIFDGPLENSIIQLQLAVDATHVYWIKSLEKAFGSSGEIWKRARCGGGAAVRIASHPFIFRLAALGDRLYFGSDSGLFSVAK
jgi:hypothetical protein